MRSVFLWSAAFLLMAGCVQTADHRTGPVAETTSPDSGPAAIRIGENSNVCVSVHVDQRLWPRPLAPDSARIFSGDLMSELRRRYQSRGGSDNLPGTHNEARFVTDENASNPACRDRGVDVFVEMRLDLRADGTPLQIDYRVARGTGTRSGRFDVDLAEEMRAGRVQPFSTRRPLELIIREEIVRQSSIVDAQLLNETH